jgi:hypothetical protein
MRETLRSAVLDDDLRRSVRNLEEERLSLRTKLNEYKRRADRAVGIKMYYEEQFAMLQREKCRMVRELDKERRDKDRQLLEHKTQVAELKRQLDTANEKANKSEMDRVLAESQFLERSSNEGLFQVKAKAQVVCIVHAINVPLSPLKLGYVKRLQGANRKQPSVLRLQRGPHLCQHRVMRVGHHRM